MKILQNKWLVSCIAVAFLFTAAVGLCVQALTMPQAVFATGGAFKIVLDAGHGGIDVGVTGVETGVKESDLNLQITYALKRELEEMGFTVALTRKTEEGLYGTTAKGFKKRDMEKRKEIIEEEKPALLLSVHQNFYATQQERGAQVFYGNNNAKSKTLALLLQNRLNGEYARQGVKNRKCMPAEYFMLRCYSAPAVIIECGFLSSPKDEALLSNEGWQKTIAESIAGGVLAFFAEQTA